MARITPKYNKDGKLISFRITVSKGRDVNGKEKTVTKSMKVLPTWSEKTARKRAEREAALFEEEVLNSDDSDSDSEILFKDYAEYVIDLKSRCGVKPTTINGYKSLTKKIYPAIGDIRLKDLKTKHINEFHLELTKMQSNRYAPREVPIEEDTVKKALAKKKMKIKDLSRLSAVPLHTCSDVVHGKSTTVESAEAIAKALDMDVSDLFSRTQEKKPLSPKTIDKHMKFIGEVLNQAVMEEIIPKNPCSFAVKEKLVMADPNTFDYDEVAVILDALENEPLKWKTMMHLILASGCRRGEILGLKWDAVDMDNNMILIRLNLLYLKDKGIYLDTPKTRNSIRDIVLPEETMAILKEYRSWQDEEKQRLGSFYKDQGFVFTQDNGSPMHPCSVTTWLKRFEKKCNFHLNAHAFRHTAASIMLEQGVDPVTVSKRLGHSSPAITTAIYAHVMEKTDTKGAAALSNILYKKNQDKPEPEK